MLETRRLFLRPINHADADAIYSMRSDPDVMRFIREPQKRSETESWIRLISSRWEKENLGFCAIIEKQSGVFLGWCGIWILPETGEIELGYAIAKQFWNQGFATEAASVFLRYAFEVLNAERVIAVTEPDNLASRRVMEKLGMRFAEFGVFYNRRMTRYQLSRQNFIAQTM